MTYRGCKDGSGNAQGCVEPGNAGLVVFILRGAKGDFDEGFGTEDNLNCSNEDVPVELFHRRVNRLARRQLGTRASPKLK